MTMIRSPRWKLVHFADSSEGQLFNLQDDPTELHNLWDSTDAQTIKAELITAILDWRIAGSLVTQRWPQAAMGQ